MEIIKSLIYDYWKNLVILLLLLLVCCSCDIQKEASKTKTDAVITIIPAIMILIINLMK